MMEEGLAVLTDFARDHAFTIAWFGLMAFVWCGWSQEDPPRAWRWVLGAGCLLGAAVAGAFVPVVVSGWDQASALDGRYGLFGVIVLIEVLVAAAGVLALSRRGAGRWSAWWVALIVALHLLPLAALLEDWSLGVLGAAQVLGLGAVAPRLREAAERPTSYLAGPLMGASFLVFAAVSILVFLARHGAPW